MDNVYHSAVQGYWKLELGAICWVTVMRIQINLSLSLVKTKKHEILKADVHVAYLLENVVHMVHSLCLFHKKQKKSCGTPFRIWHWTENSVDLADASRPIFDIVSCLPCEKKKKNTKGNTLVCSPL